MVGWSKLTGSLAEQAQYHATFALATWQVREDGAYYLLRTAEFFPHAIIHRAGPIAILEHRPDPAVGTVVATTIMGARSLDDFVEHGPVHGLIVVHRGAIVYERYPRMRPFDRHLCWSITKTFPAALIAMLEAEGRVDVRRPIDAYLPELAGTGWAGAPVLDVLDMASGIDCLEADDPDAYTNPASLFYPFEASLGMLPSAALPSSTEAYVASLRRRRPSGEAFEYASVNTFVLGWLVERLFDRPFAEIVSERIWRRLGAEADAACIVSAAGTAATHGGISATLRDVARWGVLHTSSWQRVSVAPVMPPRYLEAIRAGGRPEIFRKAAMGNAIIATLGERPRHNTYQWDFVMEDGDFFKAGFRGQGLYVSPARDLVVAYFGEQEVGQAAYARALATSGLFPASI